MKYTATLLGACALGVHAFPSMMFDIAERESKSVEEIARSINDGSLETRSLEKRVGFDPTTQYVSTTGNHAFVAPSPSDLRGPCPGLNAMANHGYIPHNGVATITQFIQGTYDVFGMVRTPYFYNLFLLTTSPGDRSRHFLVCIRRGHGRRPHIVVYRRTTVKLTSLLCGPARNSSGHFRVAQ